MVEIAGVVRSPWYRYAVIGATHRTLACTFRNTRVDDLLVVDTKNGITASKLRRSA